MSDGYGTTRRPMGMECVVQKKGLLRGQEVHLCHWEARGQQGCMNSCTNAHVDNFASQSKQGWWEKELGVLVILKELIWSIILLKHVSGTPTMFKAKNDWADGDKFLNTDAVLLSHQDGYFYFFFLLLFFFYDIFCSIWNHSLAYFSLSLISFKL